MKRKKADAPAMTIQRKCKLRAWRQLKTTGRKSTIVQRKEVTPRVMTRMRRYFVTTDSMRALANSAAMSGSTPCAPSAKFHISVEQRTGVTLSLKHIPNMSQGDVKSVPK